MHTIQQADMISIGSIFFRRLVFFTVKQCISCLFILAIPHLTEAQNKPLINSTLSGTVIDAITREPLIGALVKIEGVTNQAQTNTEGKFNLVTGQSFPYNIVVSYLGYKSKLLYVESPTPLAIDLEPDNKGLDEVVIVGYGTQKRRNITGSVASVSQANLEQPTVSFDNLLQGSVPGVNVTQSSARPGSTSTIRIRGGNSINFGNDPLYVIDGFIVYNDNSLTNTGASSGSGVNALASINPNDIESIEILKDASATAIYGSRGANGVVIVTTKKGKKGKGSVSYNNYYGVQEVDKKLSFLNGSQWAELINDINISEGQSPTYSADQIAAIGEGYDWQDHVFRNANIQNHELSFSGGQDNSRYSLVSFVS